GRRAGGRPRRRLPADGRSCRGRRPTHRLRRHLRAPQGRRCADLSVCDYPIAMPTNVTPEYRAADARYRAARTDGDRLAALEEMGRTLRKHKGTAKTC